MDNSSKKFDDIINGIPVGKWLPIEGFSQLSPDIQRYLQFDRNCLFSAAPTCDSRSLGRLIVNRRYDLSKRVATCWMLLPEFPEGV